MADDRIGQPIKIADMFLKIGRNIADTQLERGDITKEEYDDIIKILYPTPTIAKKDGGIVHMNSGGDALLGQLVANLKNKPKLASTTETMMDVIRSLDEPKDVVVERQTTKTSNVLKGSNAMRKMGPEVIEVFDKAGITKAQIAEIQKVPNINDYLDDFDGFNKAMKNCLLYTSPSPRDGLLSRMPSSA